MELIKPGFELYPRNDTIHILVVKKARLASKINKYLKHYPEDTKFTEGDEPVFLVSNAQLKTVLILLKVKGGIP